MFENDYPLLNTPNLTALILHLAETGAVTADKAAARLASLLAAAHEAPALPPAALRDRLLRTLRDLETARLLALAANGAWRLTDRGREALRRHPEGLDRPDLVEYPEYADQARASARRTADTDPRAASYDEGYEARREGQPFTANPHEPFTIDHLSWENGWMQALDDGRRG